jgi:hypothetical protein
MYFDKKYIITLFILGVILIYSYYYFLSYSNKKMELWAGIEGNLLKVYYVSMFLCVIGFIFLFNFLMYSNNLNQYISNQIFYSILSVVLLSMLWMPLSLYYLNNKSNILMYIIIFILLLVSLSTLYLLYVLNNINDNSIYKKLAIIGMIFFFIHTFFLDGITWSIKFFKII